MTPEQETAVDRLDAQTDWQEICDRNCAPYEHANALKPSPNRIRCAQYVNLARWLLDKLMWAALLDIILGGVLCAVWAVCVRIQEFLAH